MLGYTRRAPRVPLLHPIHLLCSAPHPADCITHQEDHLSSPSTLPFIFPTISSFLSVYLRLQLQLHVHFSSENVSQLRSRTSSVRPTRWIRPGSGSAAASVWTAGSVWSAAAAASVRTGAVSGESENHPRHGLTDRLTCVCTSNNNTDKVVTANLPTAANLNTADHRPRATSTVDLALDLAMEEADMAHQRANNSNMVEVILLMAAITPATTVNSSNTSSRDTRPVVVRPEKIRVSARRSSAVPAVVCWVTS